VEVVKTLENELPCWFSSVAEVTGGRGNCIEHVDAVSSGV
jgi:hypothetical protein